MPLKFGTSGVRGLVSEFTDREVYLLVTAFLKHACTNSDKTPVATGMDLRESSPNILKAAHRAIFDFGCPIYSCGVLPTPALANFAQIKKFLSLIVTGSHIPADRNGVKFYLTTGETLKQDDENIFAIYQSLRSDNFCSNLFNAEGNFNESQNVILLDTSAQANKVYSQRYTDFFTDSPLRGLKVLVYQHSSAARDILPKILTDLGASTIEIGRSDTFIPVDTEAVESLDQFKFWIKSHDADALVSTDGDGDRPLVIDNLGNLVQGDKLGILTAKLLNIAAIGLPISCNTGISQISSFKEITYTKIGSPYVVEALNNLNKKHTSVAGFEANGGFILSTQVKKSKTLEALPTRDSVLPIISILTAAALQKRKLHEIIAELPARFTSSILVKNCPLEKSSQILKAVQNSPYEFIKDLVEVSKDANLTVNNLDGVRITTKENEIIHFRPSGNAPEFRCYTEASTQQRADEISQKALRKISHMISSD
nr:phosphomannomutase [Bdellovibrio sp. HM001]